MTTTPGRDHRGEWNTSLEKVRSHIAAHGYPKQRTVAPDGSRPGKWLAKQKERWASLAPEQQEALLSLDGFALDAREAHFDEMVQLSRRAAVAGVAVWDKNATYEGRPVGQWLHDVLRGRGSMTPERAEKLLGPELMRRRAQDDGGGPTPEN